jgi:hypothetical protein
VKNVAQFLGSAKNSFEKEIETIKKSYYQPRTKTGGPQIFSLNLKTR